MTWKLLFLAICGLGLAGADKPETMHWKFEDAEVGELPKGWSSAKTGQGPGSVWKVVEDPTAPAGPKVLAQTSPDGPNGLFNLCVAAEPKLADVDLSVSLKATAGKTDQGGGLVWRYQDADNYYVVRLNPLEGDFRLFHVVKGKRTQLGKTVAVDEVVGKWHSIRVMHAGDQIQCYLNGKRHFDIKDGTIREAGRVGLWTKADAVTSFDALLLTGGGQVIRVEVDAICGDLLASEEEPHTPAEIRELQRTVQRAGVGLAEAIHVAARRTKGVAVRAELRAGHKKVTAAIGLLLHGAQTEIEIDRILNDVDRNSQQLVLNKPAPITKR